MYDAPTYIPRAITISQVKPIDTANSVPPTAPVTEPNPLTAQAQGTSDPLETLAIRRPVGKQKPMQKAIGPIRATITTIRIQLLKLNSGPEPACRIPARIIAQQTIPKIAQRTTAGPPLRRTKAPAVIEPNPDEARLGIDYSAKGRAPHQ